MSIFKRVLTPYIRFSTVDLIGLLIYYLMNEYIWTILVLWTNKEILLHKSLHSQVTGIVIQLAIDLYRNEKSVGIRFVTCLGMGSLKATSFFGTKML